MLLLLFYFHSFYFVYLTFDVLIQFYKSILSLYSKYSKSPLVFLEYYLLSSLLSSRFISVC